MLTDFYETSITGILLMRQVENLFHPEDLLHHPMLPAFNLDTYTHIHMSCRGGL